MALALQLQTSVDALLAYSQTPKYFLGIDGGATKTAFALCDGAGHILRTACLGPCNPVDIGFEKAEAVLSDGIRTVCRSIPCSEISVFAGISGGNVGCNQTIFTSFFRRFRFARIAVENDAVNIVAAGLGEEDGIAVIMGTGCVVFTQVGGVLRQYGGFGYLFDDGGDGYMLGRDGILAALREESGAGGHTVLTELLREKLGCSVSEALGDFYEKGKRYIASFAPLVTEACRRGDSIAEGILRKNMEMLGALIDSAMQDFSGRTEKVSTVLVGGLTDDFAMLEPMLTAGMHSRKRVNLKVYRFEPVLGALRRAGADIDTHSDNGLRRETL